MKNSFRLIKNNLKYIYQLYKNLIFLYKSHTLDLRYDEIIFFAKRINLP